MKKKPQNILGARPYRSTHPQHPSRTSLVPPLSQAFWSVVHSELSAKERRLLLRFITGTDRLPAAGCEALSVEVSQDRNRWVYKGREGAGGGAGPSQRPANKNHTQNIHYRSGATAGGACLGSKRSPSFSTEALHDTSYKNSVFYYL